MFLLLGLRAVASVLFSVTFVCGHCGSATAQRIVRLQRRLTVFFVPLVPVGSSWVVECDHCGITTPLTRQQAEHSMRWAAAHGLVTARVAAA